MQLKRWNDILAMKTPQGRLIAYHARNLDVAEISEELWLALNNSAQTEEQKEALEQLEEWNKEETLPTAERSQRVRNISLNVTQICNLHCAYCAAGGDGTYGDPIKRISVEKTLPQIKFFIDKLPSGESFSINYLGGEPLLYPEGVRLISEYAREYAKERDVQLTLSVTTNGTVFTEEIMQMLAKNQINITVSVDGPAETNDISRPSKDHKSTTAKVEAGFALIQKYREQLGQISVNGVFGKSNIEVLKAYEFYVKHAVDEMEFTFDHEGEDSELNKKYMEQMAEALRQAHQKGGEKELRRFRFLNKLFVNLDHKARILHYCGAGQSYLMIDSKNQVFSCPWDVNSPKERIGVGTELFEDKMRPYQDPLIEKNGCNSCWARFLCGGGCMYVHKMTTGNKNTVSDTFCERTRYLISLGIMYYEHYRTPSVSV